MLDLAAQYAAGMAQLTAARLGQMLDAGAGFRPADIGHTPVLDADGDPTTPAATAVYAGRCTLSRYRSAGVRKTVAPTVSDEAGEPELRTLKVPHGADLRPGDLWRMTVCVFAPDLPGDDFLVLHEDPRSYATYRSFTVRGSSWRPSV